MSETDIYGKIQRAATLEGHRLFRNHVGLSRHMSKSDSEARTVRHGLVPGSSDLIGWTSDGRFAAIEVKRPGWSATPSYLKSKTGKRQLAFIEAVRKAGGVAGIARSVEEAMTLLSAPSDRV